MTQFIAEVIERCYTPSPFNYLANRCRGESVLCFIKNSSLKGSEKLAWIFSAGGHEKNSLNTLLVIHLINTMLVHYKDQVGCNLSSVRHAINTKTFNSAAYTKLIMEHSSQSPAFSHSRSVSAVSNFHQAMYRWVDSFKTDQEFKLFIDKSVRKYMEPTLLNYFWKTKTEMRRCLNISIPSLVIHAAIY